MEWIEDCHSKSTFVHTLNSRADYFFFHALGFFGKEMVLVNEWTLALCVNALAYFTSFHSLYRISDGVSCQLHITAARVRSQVKSYGIWDGQNGTRMSFLWFHLPVLIPPTALHSLIIVSLTLYHRNHDSIAKLPVKISQLFSFVEKPDPTLIDIV
jgi:hypothetical protein